MRTIPRAHVLGHVVDKFGAAIRRTTRALVVFAVALLCLAVPASAMYACSSVTKTATEAGSAFVDCSKADLGALVTDGATQMTVLGKVAQIIAAGGDGWQAALEQLGAKVGEVELACAAKAAATVFAASAPPSTGSAGTAETSSPATRAQNFLESKGWKFSEPHAALERRHDDYRPWDPTTPEGVAIQAMNDQAAQMLLTTGAGQ